MSVELYTLEGTDEDHEEVIALLRLALGQAEEAEVVHPETVSALRQWCNAEHRRLNPLLQTKVPYDARTTINAALRQSPWWSFWESLEAGQEVRWTGTKSATYFVVDPTPSLYIETEHHRQGPGAYIELRRHTGKTFWTHIGQVRPLDAH